MSTRQSPSHSAHTNPRRMNKLSSALFVLALVAAVQAQAPADPGFPTGMYAIRPDPSPGIVDELNQITVLTMNYGGSDATGVEVELNYNDWGVTYHGWQTIGTTVVDIPANGNVEHVFEHIFENRAHTCLEVKVLNVASGGNDATFNDRTQINWEVVNAGEDVYIYIPFGNGADEEIVVNGTEILCMVNDTFVPCPGKGRHDDRENVPAEIAIGDRLNKANLVPQQPVAPQEPAPVPQEPAPEPAPEPAGRRRLLQFADGLAPYLIGAPTSLAPHSEQVAQLVVSDVPEDGMVVMVQAYMNGELNNVMINIVRTTVEDLLNSPMLCCIKSVRTRVMLETLLRDALIAYEAKDCRRAQKLLRLFVQKAILLLCDLTPAEKACIEKALLKVVDAARMIALNLGPHPKLWCPAATQKIKDGDYFRRQGLYEAAILQYAKACSC